MIRLTLARLCIILLFGSACVAADEHSHSSEMPTAGSTMTQGQVLAEMAARPYRPAWGPLPILRGDTGTLPLLHRLLSSPDAHTRARIALVLGQVASPESVPLLADHLKDPDRDVRVHSGIALASIGDERGIPVCAAVLGDAPAWVRYYAVWGLWSTNSQRAKDILKRHVNDGDPLVTETIEEALTTPYVAPPKVEASGNSEHVDEMTTDQVWFEVCDAFITESDWWWHKGRYDQSIRCLEAAVFVKPDYVDGYSSIAWLQWSMGDDPLAIRTLNRGIKACPSDPEAWFALGFHYYNTDRYAQAEEPLAKAVELDPEHIGRRTYAHCLEQLGKLKESVAQWETIVEADPSDEPAKKNLERVRKLLESGEDS